MAQKKLSASYKQIQQTINGDKKIVSTGAVEKCFYVDGKKTETLENVVLSAISQDLGEIQLVFPPRRELVEELNTELPFGSTFSIADVGEVTDVKIGFYNGSLTFKFQLEKEIEL